MSVWIVSNVPAWLLLLALIVVIAGGAVLIQRAVRRRFPKLADSTHNDVTRFAYGVVGFVYAFFIGFVVSAMWSQINTEDGQARNEAAAAVQLANDATVFDKADSQRVRQALLDYERAALAEWPVAANGRSYPDADKAMQRLYATYDSIQPQTETQKTFLNRSFTNLDKVSQARTERVLQAQTAVGPSWSLWMVIMLTSGLVLACSVIYGVEEPRMHYAMVTTVGVLVAANLFLVMELSHPFVGELATTPEPLRDVVEVLSAPAT
ncbi:DUF4239 domain-containing protein [Mycobacterium kubicae]|uniref:bestrophin-like domain n=1 Tax=Mycobacterium kubicae TaxID=120959 RepID=UPI00164180DF|nr:DUF4239 domain-containing protein [Mycobacterium kubicae]QNI08371.1 DUF4239 domain-containing protein [Mycobacterium kubicae]